MHDTDHRGIAMAITIATTHQVFVVFYTTKIFIINSYSGNQGKTNKSRRNKNGSRKINDNKYGNNIYDRMGLKPVDKHHGYLPPNVKSLHRDVRTMMDMLDKVLKRSADPRTLPECFRVVCEAKLFESTLKVDVLKYMVKTIFTLSYDGILPSMSDTTCIQRVLPSNVITSEPSVLHSELPVLGYPSCPYPSTSNYTSRIPTRPTSWLNAPDS